MYQLNRVTLIGRLTADPQTKAVKDGSTMALCGIATNYAWKDAQGNTQQGVDYHRVVAFGRLAEQMANGLAKGQRVFIEGKLRTRAWKDASGANRYTTEVLARTCIFMDVTKSGVTEQESNDVQPEAETAELPVEVEEVELW